jgi:uncharacterized membrane protein YfcA
MTDFLVVGITAFVASGLTLYSGFGLGTVLLPAFALFFPAAAAVAATGAVHLLNNLFKGGLVGWQADWSTVLRFGLPAIPGAIAGALLLSLLNEQPTFDWGAFGLSFAPSAAGIVVGACMIVFAILELQPWFQRLSAPPNLVTLGGFLTGFSGGLTGQQGALRSMFLFKSGLAPASYIATGTMIAILIDLARLPTYAATFSQGGLPLWGRSGALVATGTLCAFAGAWLGARYMKTATIAAIRALVVSFMVLIGAALILGVLGA